MAIQERSVQLLRKKTGPVLFAAMMVISLSWLTACGSAALEEKRLSDQCNSTYGFNSPKAIACQESGSVRFAMHDS
jgi:hypothetical protein